MRLRWQDKALFGVAILFIVIQLNMFSELRQLPGPLFGGDFYHSLGVINHLYYGGTIFENSQMLGEYPWTPPLYHGIVTLFAKATGLGTLDAVMYVNILTTLIIAAVAYILAALLLKNRTLALAFSAYILLATTPTFHYHSLRTISSLLMILMLFYSQVRRTWWTAAGAGAAWGLVMLSHASAGAAATVLVGLWLAYVVAVQYIGFRSLRLTFRLKEFRQQLKANARYAGIILATGFLLSLIYWFVPIFVFKLSTPNKMQEFSYVRVDSLYYQLKVAFGYLLNNFKVSFAKNPLQGMFAVLFSIGLLSIIFVRQKTKETRFVLFLFAAAFLGYFHPVLTQNLLGFNLTPGSIGGYVYIGYWAIIALMGFQTLAAFAKQYYRRLNTEYANIGFVAVVLLLAAFAYKPMQTASPFYEAGKQPLGGYLQEMSDWVIQNTDVRDVFLTDNEDAFMLNALTGRKVVTSRRAHSGMFVDVDSRYLDAALILHGSDDTVREGLLRKHNVKYLFWHAMWLQNEIRVNENGEIVGFFDPLLLQDKNDYAQTLAENNVTFTELHTWLDPALRSEDYLQYDALLVYPNFNLTQPWGSALNKYLRLEKSFSVQGVDYIRIYRIDMESYL